jgi:hypothetical protein
MDIEKQFPSFYEWLVMSSGDRPEDLGALWLWLLGCVGLILAGTVGSWVYGSVLHGPGKAGDRIFKVLVGTLSDLLHTSPRRVSALAWLAVKESIRRQAPVGLALYIVFLAFVGWLYPGPYPAKLYLSIVPGATTYLVLFLALVLSAFSLPADIQSKTIFTIVTKPVRCTEIVIGRILGFTISGTILLAVMGVVGYFFIVRMLDHTHVLTADDLSPVESKSTSAAGAGGWTGWTRTARRHMHEVRLDSSGKGVTLSAQSHTHHVLGSDGQGGYEVGPPLGEWLSRVPVYGTLEFLDRAGNPTATGINVGNEWMYRSYIEGGSSSTSKARAVWTFSDLRREDFPNGLILELNIRVFRTYKGKIDQGVAGRLRLVNPEDTNVYHDLPIFFAKEYTLDRHEIPLVLKHEGQDLDLFRDLAPRGRLRIELACLASAQYYGMAKPDMYLLRREGVNWLNFAKGYVSIWMQMVLITTFGVMFSTFLSGPVAALSTLAALVGGFQVDIMKRVGTGEQVGGGMIESFIRMLGQEPMQSQLDSTVANNVGLFLDQILRGIFVVVARLLPDFDALTTTHYVKEGYDISSNLLSIHVMMMLGYALPVMLIGIILFKVREVAK